MSARREGSSPEPDPAVGAGKPRVSARALARVVEGGSRPQSPAAAAYVGKLRAANPAASPADIVAKLERRFLAVVMIGGAAVGLAAALPGIGTLAALVAIAGETVLFLEATAVFVLALAEVHGVPVDQRERRRALVLAVLVGEDNQGGVAELLGPTRTRGGWLSDGMAALPLPAVSQLNWRMIKHFAKRYTLRRGALMFGKLLPAGIGAVIGAVGNRIVGKKIIGNARRAFGNPPARWPVALHLLPPVRDAS